MALDKPDDSVQLKVKWRETFDTVTAWLVAQLSKTRGVRGGRHIGGMLLESDRLLSSHRTRKQKSTDGKTPLAR